MSKYYYAEYPASQYEVWLAGIPYQEQPKKPLTLSAWAAKTGADIVYPLAMYNMTGGNDQYGPIYGRTLQYVRAGGMDIGYGGSDYVLGFDPLEQIVGANKAGAHKDACAGYKAAIVSGCIVPGLSRSGRRSRNVNGIAASGEYFHMLTEDGVTEYECAEYLKARGAKFALMQDGGGTTAKYENGRVVFAPEGGRPTCSVVCIRRRSGATQPEGDKNNMKEYVNNSSARKPVYETTACKKQIGSLDPYERCTLLYSDAGFDVVMYYITGSAERKVGFVRR